MTLILGFKISSGTHRKQVSVSYVLNKNVNIGTAFVLMKNCLEPPQSTKDAM